MISVGRSLFQSTALARTTTAVSKRSTVLASPCILPSASVLPQQIQQQIRHRSNRSRRGLYDGKDIRSGNNVSFSMKCTKRKFKPNVFTKRVYSETLDEMMRFHLTAAALRSIDKAVGLDNYLLNNDTLTEGEGYEAKRKILNRLKNQARYDRKAVERQQESAALLSSA
jgi:large subunit ribosomal protein L28